jgi:hypothetical protein
MKKLVTIFALFTLVMLTSFVEPNEVGGKNQNIGKSSVNISSSNEVGGKNQNIGKTSVNISSSNEVGGKNQNIG